MLPILAISAIFHESPNYWEDHSRPIGIVQREIDGTSYPQMNQLSLALKKRAG
jgi:hypothetical protein